MPAFLPVFLWLHLFFLSLSPCACLCWVCAGSPHALEFMLFLTTVSLHSVYVGVLSASAPMFYSLVLPSAPLHAVCCLTVSAASFLLSVFQVLALLVCSLPLCFSFPLSHCLVVYWGSKKRDSLLLSVQKKSHSVFDYEENAKDEWFFCIFDLSLFPVAHVTSGWANEQP